MTRTEAMESLRALQPELRKLGVRSIALFGSVLRDEAGPQSDLDLVAEFDPPHTAKQYFDTLFLIEDSLGVGVDLAEPSTLHPSIRDRILQEAHRVE
ncbi:MAG: nucleotidyltransferase family protein [Fimbriimonas sp.]|nr:nucleotidyltransferase family protein [Fimbriimonas sp.]